jgi:hypothetical protein
MRPMTRHPFAAATGAVAILCIAVVMLAAATVGAAPKSDDGPPLSKEQWTKIAKRIAEAGTTRDLPFKVAEHLGLTKGTQVMTVRELAFEREGYQHGVYRSVDPKDDRIILAFRTPEKRWTAFLTDARFQLALAIVWNAGETPEQWAYDQALPAFNNELGYWSVVADLL